MSVTIDQHPLAAEEMGLRTIGQVLAHVQRKNRLVVQLLVDGQEPDFSRLGQVRSSPLNGHTLYIETADPREMALEVLHEVEAQLDEADRLKTEASELLQRNQHFKAMERLSGCFSTWQHAQESVVKTAELLRIDLNRVRVDNQTLTELVQTFTGQLRQIKSALENRDFVMLSDILAYETTQTSAHWRAALRTMRGLIQQ
jgi:hypothetical protein